METPLCTCNHPAHIFACWGDNGECACREHAVSVQKVDTESPRAASSTYKPHPLVAEYMEAPETDLYGLTIYDCADAMARFRVAAETRNANLMTALSIALGSGELSKYSRSKIGALAPAITKRG